MGKREERIQNTSGSAVGTAAALASHPGLAAQIGGAGPLVLGALALLVVAGPYWGGLLLPAQYMPVAVLLLLAVGWGVRSGSGFPAGAYPILVGGGVVVLGYFASVAGAAHPNAAFLEVYRALLPYLALMAGLRCHLNEARLLCWGVAAAAVGSLVLGLLGPVGGPAPEAMWADGRLQGVFQYANATADYLAVGAITGLWLGAKSGARAWQLAGGVAGCLCLTGVFLTGSRAVLPFLALALVSLVLFAPSEFFRRRASLTGTALLGAVLGANISLTYYVAGRPWAALAGCLVPLLLVPVALIRPCRSSRPGTDDAVRPAQRALATAGIAAGLAVQGLVAGLFGRRFVLAASEFQERLVYYSDALRIVRDHALLGVGGDGWRSVQYGYQSACYSVGLVHSYPLQVVLDAGVVAAVGFILVLAAFGRAVLRGLRESFPERRDVLCLGVSCVTLLFGHNLLDLSLAYPPLAGLGWFFLASPWWGTGPGRPLGQGRVGTACRRASLLVWLVLLAGAGYGTAGEWQARAVQARAWAGDLHGAWAGYADLVRWYRAPAHVHHEMGRVWEAELRRTLEGSQCERSVGAGLASLPHGAPPRSRPAGPCGSARAVVVLPEPLRGGGRFVGQGPEAQSAGRKTLRGTGHGLAAGRRRMPGSGPGSRGPGALAQGCRATAGTCRGQSAGRPQSSAFEAPAPAGYACLLVGRGTRATLPGKRGGGGGGISGGRWRPPVRG